MLGTLRDRTAYLVTTFVLMEYIMSTLMSESVLQDEDAQNPKHVRLEVGTAPLEPGSRLGQRIAQRARDEGVRADGEREADIHQPLSFCRQAGESDDARVD